MIRQYILILPVVRRVGILLFFSSQMSRRSKHVEIDEHIGGETGANVLCSNTRDASYI